MELLGVLTVIAVTSLAYTIKNERYDEELIIRPLANNHVNTYFQFSTNWFFGKRDNLHNTNLVPRVIADMVLEYDVKEMHISLTQGIWRYETWGYPRVDAAGGAESWAWFNDANLTSKEIDIKWSRLMGIFSGILCVSLNFVDKTNSIAPKFSFRPLFVDGTLFKEKYVRYATLPREIVCTENLTPWKKLLPCGNSIGIASLLNSGNVYNTKFHSLGVRLRTLCTSAENCSLQFTQTANIVYDLKLLDNNRNDFSLRRLFGQGLNGRCTLAKTSRIYIQRNEQGAKFELSPPPLQELITTRGNYNDVYAVYELRENKKGDRLFNVACLERKILKTEEVIHPPLVHANRFILGQGQQSGRIVTEITNTYGEELYVLVQEMLPWFVALYLHTLKIRAKSIISLFYEDTDLLPNVLHFVPSKQRTSPTHLEIGLTLPAKTTIRVSIDCDYMMLKWLEYPPDANNGHNIGSSVITTLLPIGRNHTAMAVESLLFADMINATRISGYHQTLRTEALIVSLPTPDFSMPYNVICLACTVVALAFGPIHSVATKQMTIDTTSSLNGNFLRQIWNKYFKRKTKVSAVSESDNHNIVILEK